MSNSPIPVRSESPKEGEEPPYSMYWTTLHDAIMHGEPQLVDTLISKGVCIEAKTRDGSRPLHIAANRGNVSIVRILVTAGAQLNAKDGDGMTPLHVAAGKKHLVIVKELLKAGATALDAREWYRLTSLYLPKTGTVV